MVIAVVQRVRKMRRCTPGVACPHSAVVDDHNLSTPPVTADRQSSRRRFRPDDAYLRALIPGQRRHDLGGEVIIQSESVLPVSLSVLVLMPQGGRAKVVAVGIPD